MGRSEQLRDIVADAIALLPVEAQTRLKLLADDLDIIIVPRGFRPPNCSGAYMTKIKKGD